MSTSIDLRTHRPVTASSRSRLERTQISPCTGRSLHKALPYLSKCPYPPYRPHSPRAFPQRNLSRHPAAMAAPGAGWTTPEPGRNSTSSTQKSGAASATSSAAPAGRLHLPTGCGRSGTPWRSSRRILICRNSRRHASVLAGTALIEPAPRSEPGCSPPGRPGRGCLRPTNRKETNSSVRRGIESREDRQGLASLRAVPVAREHDSLPLRQGPAWKHRQLRWVVRTALLAPARPGHPIRAHADGAALQGYGMGAAVSRNWSARLTGTFYSISRRVRPARAGAGAKGEPRRALKKRFYWVKNCANFHSNRVQFCDGCRALPV